MVAGLQYGCACAIDGQLSGNTAASGCARAERAACCAERAVRCAGRCAERAVCCAVDHERTAGTVDRRDHG